MFQLEILFFFCEPAEDKTHRSELSVQFSHLQTVMDVITSVYNLLCLVYKVDTRFQPNEYTDLLENHAVN